MNSFLLKYSEKINSAENNYYVKKIIKIKVKPLHEILDYYLKDLKIDFLNVDVEGFDLNVLQSNDRSEYRPRFILAEILENGSHNIDQDKVVKFMKEQGYAIYAKQMNTVFLKIFKSVIDISFHFLIPIEYD